MKKRYESPAMPPSPPRSSVALSLLSAALPIEESDRMLAVLDEAIEVGTQIGDRLAVVSSIAMKGWIAAYRGDHRAALDAAVESAERSLQAGDLGNPALVLAAVALTHLGHAEPAAVLDTVGTRFGFGAAAEWQIQLATDAKNALVAQLGQAALDILRSQASALTPFDALAYLINAVQTAIPNS